MARAKEFASLLLKSEISVSYYWRTPNLLPRIVLYQKQDNKAIIIFHHVPLLKLVYNNSQISQVR